MRKTGLQRYTYDRFGLHKVIISNFRFKNTYNTTDPRFYVPLPMLITIKKNNRLKLIFFACLASMTKY